MEINSYSDCACIDETPIECLVKRSSIVNRVFLISVECRCPSVPSLEFHAEPRRLEYISNIIITKMQDQWLSIAKRGQCLPELDLVRLCERLKDILVEESNVQRVCAPVNICGNINGQFYDLIKLFCTGGEIPDKKYIFMGNYVNKGCYSVETIQLLFVLKVCYPRSITLLRGNMDARQISQVYGFYDECVGAYGSMIAWRCYTDVFDYLNIAAVVDNTIFCVHGGISPDAQTLDQIQTIERRVEIPHEGPFTDLIWSDPDDIEWWNCSPRGAGFLYGSKAAEEFCHINDLTLICRGHQLVMEGYKFWFPFKNVVTVWSAPNYCCRCGNVAAILAVDEVLEYNFHIFDCAPESKKTRYRDQIYPSFKRGLLN